MRTEAEASRATGFVGKGAIHPRQIPVIHEVFSPSPGDIEEARRIVEAFDEGRHGPGGDRRQAHRKTRPAGHGAHSRTGPAHGLISARADNKMNRTDHGVTP